MSNTSLQKDQIHNQFVQFGIQRGAQYLLNQHQDTKKIIGCSVGGVIAWNAAIQGLKLDLLVTISSTRLRYQTHRPDCQIFNFFGKDDLYRPDTNWMNEIGKHSSEVMDGDHFIYKTEDKVKYILKKSNLIL